MQRQVNTAFILVCIAWSFSWFALKMQVGINPFVAVGYRFILATICMLFIAKYFNYSLKINKNIFKYIVITALCSACFNFVFAYKAAKYIPSGMIAAIFSLSILFGEILNAIVEKKAPNKKRIINGLIGCGGLVLFIFPTLKFSLNFFQTLNGILLAAIGPLLASMGLIAIRTGTKNYPTPLVIYMVYAFAIGATVSLIMAFLNGADFTLPLTLNYIGSLLYLAIVASCIAIFCLAYLSQKIGPSKANFSCLVYTIGAIWISTYFEDYSWQLINVVGFSLVIISMLLEFFNNKR